MEDDNWKKVVNHRNKKRKIKQKEVEEEKNKWENLKIDIPHIVLPVRAQRLQKRLRIDNLEKMLLSDEFINHQKVGWKYVKVLKSHDKTLTDTIPSTTTEFPEELITYSIMNLDNKWGDTVLFSMTIKNEENISNCEINKD